MKLLHWYVIFGSDREQLLTPLQSPFIHYRIFDQTNLKTFADDKLNVTKMIISVFDGVENIVGKGEIDCTSNFSFSHNVFKGSLPRPVKRCHCVGMG